MFQSLGNHEFDNGVSGLTPLIENLSCPVLAANLILNKVPELENEENLKKSVVFDIEGVKVGIIGYLTPETKVLAVHNDVEYISEIIALKEEVKKLQNNDVRIIIALGHSGFSRDLEIAREVEGLDLVIGGHTNTFLWNGTSPDSEKPLGPYPMYIEQTSGRQVPVVQAYAYTKYLGRLHMVFNTIGETISIDGNPILLDASIPQDPEVLDIIQSYRGNVLNVADEVIGNASTFLDGISCKRKECNLGNLITDAMLDRYVSHYRGDHWTDTAIAMVNGGSIRASIVHPDIHTQVTKGDLLTVIPFEERLVALTMNGTILIKLLEHSVSHYESIDDPGEFMQFSGIRVVYDVDKPSGSRVVTATVRCAACDVPAYKPINKTQIYKVIVPEFLSNGGDGYHMLKGLPLEILRFSELMSTQHYIRHHSPVHPEEEGRITILGRSVQNNVAANVPPSICLVLVLSIFFNL